MTALQRLAGLSIAVCAGAATLYLFPPEVYGFYPVCPVFRVFGVHCPGCGMTRAISHLLHGEFAESIRLNLLAIPVTALCGALYVRQSYAVLRERFR